MLAAKSGGILRSSYSWERANGNTINIESGTADFDVAGKLLNSQVDTENKNQPNWYSVAVVDCCVGR